MTERRTFEVCATVSRGNYMNGKVGFARTTLELRWHTDLTPVRISSGKQAEGYSSSAIQQAATLSVDEYHAFLATSGMHRSANQVQDKIKNLRIIKE